MSRTSEGPVGVLLRLLDDASEFALYNIERELLEVAAREGLATRIVALLGSVQDHARMRLLLEGFQVQTVYHAAAYKHVPLVEHNVIEYPDSYPADEPNRRCPDIRKAQLQLKFHPEVGLDEGLRRFFSWTDRTYTGEQ